MWPAGSVAAFLSSERRRQSERQRLRAAAADRLGDLRCWPADGGGAPMTDLSESVSRLRQRTALGGRVSVIAGVDDLIVLLDQVLSLPFLRSRPVDGGGAQVRPDDWMGLMESLLMLLVAAVIIALSADILIHLA